MRERAVEALDRVREPAKRDQHVGAAAMRVGSAERNRLIKACQRLGMAPDVTERHSEQRVEARLPRIERERAAHEIDAFGDLALLTACARIAIESIRGGAVRHRWAHMRRWRSISSRSAHHSSP